MHLQWESQSVLNKSNVTSLLGTRWTKRRWTLFHLKPMPSFSKFIPSFRILSCNKNWINNGLIYRDLQSSLQVKPNRAMLGHRALHNAYQWLWKSSCQNKRKKFFWWVLKDRLESFFRAGTCLFQITILCSVPMRPWHYKISPSLASRLPHCFGVLEHA